MSPARTTELFQRDQFGAAEPAEGVEPRPRPDQRQEQRDVAQLLGQPVEVRADARLPVVGLGQHLHPLVRHDRADEGAAADERKRVDRASRKLIFPR